MAAPRKSKYQIDDPFEEAKTDNSESKKDTLKSATPSIKDEIKSDEVETKKEIKPEPVVTPTVEEKPKDEIKPEFVVTPTVEEKPKDEIKLDITISKYLHIYVKFVNNVTPITCVSALNHNDTVVATNKELRLIQNKFYYIPVSETVNSDDYDNLKIFSDMADIIDVRHIKDGIACVMPLKHNILLSDGDRLCAIW